MKNLFLSFTLTLSLLISGCGEREESGIKSGIQKTDSANSSKILTDNLSQSFTLKYKLEKGRDYNYKLITNQIENIQIQNNDTTVQNNAIQQVTYLMNFKVERTDNNKTAELTCRVTSVKLDADANGTKFSFQTGQPKNEEELRNFAQYESFMNNSFGLKISEYGDIIEVFRTDKIINKFIAINKMQDTITASGRERLKRDLSEVLLKPLLSQIFRKFPEEKMAIDSSWSIPQEPMPLASLVMRNTNIYKISGVETLKSDTLAVIEGEMKSEVTGQQIVTDRGVKYFFEKPKAAASGKIYFSITSGTIQSSRTSTRLENSFTAEASSPMGPLKETQRRRVENSVTVESL
jgi:hypothetical protein